MDALSTARPAMDRYQALSHGSPEVASLIVALTAIAGRALVGRVALRLVRAREA